MKATVKQITLPPGKRVICISDIHGNLDLLLQLLDKVSYSEQDILLLLGDIFRKGKQCKETLRYVMDLSEREHVHVLRGNSDWTGEAYLSEEEKAWIEALPHIIESERYVFVHGGIGPGALEEQEAWDCMKNDAFAEKGLSFDKYVVVGHWPTVNYTHEIPCNNPIIDHERRIISIDGGAVLKVSGQLNALIIHHDVFSFEAVDALPDYAVRTPQEENGGSINITWNDRFVELMEQSERVGVYRHLASGRLISLPLEIVWKDRDGNLCACGDGTDYRLPVQAGETVSFVGCFGDEILAKKNGFVGWIPK